MSRREITLVFTDDVVISTDPIDAATEKLVDALLGDMVVSKCRVWCG